MASRFILPYADIGNGISPSNGAQLFFYTTGTTTLKDTYSDEALSTANANPVIADADGVFGDVWMADGARYKVTLKDKDGVQIWESDPVIGSPSASLMAKMFDNLVTDLDGSAEVFVGDIVETAGYTTKGDGGGNLYEIVAAGTGTDDGGSYIDLTTSGLQAKGLFPNGVNARQFGAKGDGVSIDSPSIQAAIDYLEAKGEGGEVFIPAGDYLCNLKADTVAKDVDYGIGSAIELKSWVSLRGEGLGTIGGTETSTRINLNNAQNCSIFGAYGDSLGGLSGCSLSWLTLRGNRDNNVTDGHGIFVRYLYSSSNFSNLKIGSISKKGIFLNGSSTPVWFTNLFITTTGDDGILIDGAATQAVNLLNIQVDGAGMNGAATSAGIRFLQGSTNDTQILISNFRYEHNTALGTNTKKGIVFNSMNFASCTVVGAYGFSNSAGVSDSFIQVTGNTARVNLIGITTNNKYTNVFEDVANSKTIAYSTSGIPAMFESVDLYTQMRLRSKSTNSESTIQVTTSSQLDINNPANGTSLNDVRVYGPTILGLNVDESTQTGTNRGRCETDSILVRAVDATFALILSGPGNPNGRGDASAPVGSRYYRTDGGAGTSEYAKETGTGNTGWVAK